MNILVWNPGRGWCRVINIIEYTWTVDYYGPYRTATVELSEGQIMEGAVLSGDFSMVEV